MKREIFKKGIKMPFIGIVGKVNDSNFIKNGLTKNSENTKFEIININNKSIENIKNIKFDVLVINENNFEILNNSKYLEGIMSQAGYIIVNSDIQNNLSLLKNTKLNIITYGFNAKCTITVSSIKDEDTLICVQRNIKRVNGKIIEEQEFNIKIEKNNIKKLYNTLVIFTILAIFGENLKKI